MLNPTLTQSEGRFLNDRRREFDDFLLIAVALHPQRDTFAVGESYYGSYAVAMPQLLAKPTLRLSLPPMTSSSAFNLRRFLHTSNGCRREESKVEEALEAIKETIKKKEAQPATSPTPGVASPDAAASDASSAVVVPKKSLKERVVAELKHYYHGFRLLAIDVRVGARLVWQLLNGKSLSRREQKQLVRTTADMFRLVPFLVFIIVPFAEFLLPVALKLFPGMLPSTFQEADKEKEKARKRLIGKLEMAKFLQDTIEETALQRTGEGEGENVQEFSNFMNKIRTSGEQTSNEEILKFSQLFEDEITLDNLNHGQLSALCKLLEVPTMGTSGVLRFQLEMKLRQLAADDKMIQKEGIDSMAVWELQDACRMRGMRAIGVPEERLKTQLAQWLDLHLNRKVPTSLLLLSRTLYFVEHLSAEEQIKATISALPDSTAEEAKVKILEVSGDRVDNKSKLEVIKQEEEIIQKEKEEQEAKKKEEEKAKALEALILKAKEVAAAASAAAAAAAEGIKVAPAMVDKATVLTPSPAEVLTSRAEEMLADKVLLDRLALEKAEEIDSADLSRIESMLERVAEAKLELNPQAQDLKALKEDVTEYKENLQDLQGVVATSGGTVSELKESKAAQRLSKKVERLIGQIDVAVLELSKKTEELMGDIKVKEEHIEGPAAAAAAATPAIVQEKLELYQEKRHFITIVELLESIKSATDSSKFEKIAKVLDEDKDGAIDVSDALKVIELLGKENMKLQADQLSEIMDVLRKENNLKEEQRKNKKLQQAIDAIPPPQPPLDLSGGASTSPGPPFVAPLVFPAAPVAPPAAAMAKPTPTSTAAKKMETTASIGGTAPTDNTEKKK